MIYSIEGFSNYIDQEIKKAKAEVEANLQFSFDSHLNETQNTSEETNVTTENQTQSISDTSDSSQTQTISTPETYTKEKTSTPDNILPTTKTEIETTKPTTTPSSLQHLLDQANSYSYKYPSFDVKSDKIHQYDSYVQEASKKYGVPEPLIRSVIKAESDFNPKTVSSAGAVGLMQLMPENIKTLQVKNPYDPKEAIDAGTKHLKDYIDRYHGDYVLGLAAYNAGPGNVDKYGGIPPFKETQNYVKKVLGSIQTFM